jgi:hypothetical protein
MALVLSRSCNSDTCRLHCNSKLRHHHIGTVVPATPSIVVSPKKRQRLGFEYTHHNELPRFMSMLWQADSQFLQLLMHA